MKFKKIMAVLLASVMLSSLTVAGCGSTLNAEEVVATLDDKEIKLGVANFMAQCQAVQYDSYLLSYYGETMWSSDAGDGSTMTESVKSSVMDTLEEYYLLDAHAGDYDVALTEEEQKKITQTAEQFLSDNTTKAANVMGADKESVEEMLRLYAIHSKVYQAIIEGIDTNVTDEESAQKTFSYIRFDSNTVSSGDDSSADNSSTDDTSTDELSSDEIGAIAHLFLASLQNSTLEEQAEAGGYTISTCSYGASDLVEADNSTNLDISVLKAAEELSDGEVAEDVVAVDDTYYVIRMDSVDDKDAQETKKESILSERRSTLYEEVLQGYKDDSNWSIKEDVWEKVNFDNLYTIAASEDTAVDDTTTDTTTEDTTAEDTAADNAAESSDGENTGTDDAE